MAIINGTKTLVGNREHKKTLGGGGAGEQVNLLQGNTGTGIFMGGPRGSAYIIKLGSFIHSCKILT